MNKEFNKEEYNKMCAEFIGWELHLAKNALNWPDGTFMEWDDEEEFWIMNPTEEFKKFRIVCHTEEVGLGYRFKLFDQYYYKSGLRFDEEWNWIMVVVEEIENLVNSRVDIDSSHVLIQYNDWFTIIQKESKKEAVVEAIWEFLNYYKENKE